MNLPISLNKISSYFEEMKQQKIVEKETELKLKDVVFDFETNDFLFAGTETKNVHDIKSIVKGWIKKLFFTRRNYWNVYTMSLGYPFGLDLHKYIGQELYPHMDIIELIKNDIYYSLLNHNEIKEIHCLQLVQVGEKMYCGFIVELKNGTGFEMEEKWNVN